MTELRGIPASPGTRRGTARWVFKLADIERLATGDVLLAKMTSPDWIIAFQKVYAIATEQGGALCHAAVVAREMALPAVVGIGPTLREIKDGDLIEVDGTAGLLKRLPGKPNEQEKDK
jgi:pyruvate, water dikinase